MRVLFPYPDTSADRDADVDLDADGDLHACYTAGWSGRGGLRANFISSVDGAISVGGLSRGLQTDGDNRVFAALRDLADVVVVGAGTARDEGYSALHQEPHRQAARRALGFAAQLPLAIVTRSLRLDPAARLFTSADPDARTIVLTCEAGNRDVRAALAGVADVVICGEHDVDLPAAMAALADRGLRHVLCEGGPLLFASLAAAGLVDELCLSLSPMLAGPGAGRVTAGGAWAHAPLGMRLAGVLEEENALFCRYALPR